MREMKQYEGGVWTSKNTIKDGLLHQFQYTKLFIKDSSLLLAIQTGGATRQWGRKKIVFVERLYIPIFTYAQCNARNETI